MYVGMKLVTALVHVANSLSNELDNTQVRGQFTIIIIMIN